MRLPSWLQRAKRPRAAFGEDGDEDVEAIIFRNLWKHHRLLPPQSRFKTFWDPVRTMARM